MTDRDLLKRMAAEQAVDFIKSDMVIGLGTGSTVSFVLLLLSERIKDGLLRNVAGVPSSWKTEEEARRLGIPLTTLDLSPQPDLNIDGADEVDPRLNLIKGRGGALLREKVLAQASQQTIIIVDEGKLSASLGTHMPLPVEVLSFALRPETDYLTSLGAIVSHRTLADGKPFITDEGNYILDCNFGPIKSPENLASLLERRAGIVEHGLFVGLASRVIVAGARGVWHLKKKKYDYK